ncbi:MAG: peptidoglycan-binding protein [Candidatus Paceibacterota bacterium]
MNLKLKKVAIATISAGFVAGAVMASAQSASTCFQFTQNMKLGSSGAQVLQLQKTLNAAGYTISTSGVGSAGMETTYFGAKTKAAVIKYQAANNIIQTGNVFALTRAALNANCTATTPTTPGNTTTSGAVSVALASVQPNNVLVAGSVNAALANLSFNGNGTVSSVKLQRLGVSNSDTLTNVYLYDTASGARLTDGASVLTDGTVSFNNGYGLFTVSGSKGITVRADIATSSNGYSTSGQSVGFALVGYTTVGNPAAVVSGVNGPALPIGSASVVSANITATSSVASQVDAGRQNVVFWSGTVNTTKDSYMSGALFSFTGSAPYSVFANVKLYVDGVQVGNAGMIDANGKLSFAGSNFIKAGNHDISLRGDVVGGAGRNYYVRLENSGLSFEDANIRGVYGAITTFGVNFSTSLVQTGTVTINSCSSTNCAVFTSDSSFSGVKVVSGATQQTIGKFTLKAIGETLKLDSGNLKVTGATNTGDIRNVSVWVDGVQVVSGKTASLAGSDVSISNFSGAMVQMGATANIEIKADISSSTGIALGSNTLTAGLNFTAIGQDSRNSTPFSYVTSNSVSVGTLNASFVNNSNFTGSKISGTQNNVKVGSYTLSTGNEGVTLNTIAVTLTPGGSADMSRFSNFRLMDGSTQLYSQSNLGSGTSAQVVTASVYVQIPANTTKTYDVFVDANNASAGNTLTSSSTASYQGAISLTTATPSAGSAVTTTVAASGLASIVKGANALTARYVTGGSVNNAGLFTLVATGTTLNVTKIQAVVSNASAVSGMTIAGVTAQPKNNGVYSVDVNLPVTTIGTDVPVSVTFNTANRDTNSLSGATTTVSLSYIYGTAGATTVIVGTEDATSTASTTALGAATSSTFTLVGALPTVKLTSVDRSYTQSTATSTYNNIKIGSVTITPSAGGTVAVSQIPVSFTSSIVTSARLVHAGDADTSNPVSSNALSTSGNFALTSGNISSPVTYDILATIVVPANTNSTTVSNSTSLGSSSNFLWDDVTGSVAVDNYTAALLVGGYTSN